MSKEEILERLENGKCTSLKECKQWIDTMNTYLPKPSKLKKGDIFAYGLNGVKSRPHVIYKVIGKLVVSIPLTTTLDEMTIHFHKSRFMGNGYFSKSIVFVKASEVENKLMNVLDDTKNLNIAYKMIKDLL